MFFEPKPLLIPDDALVCLAHKTVVVPDGFKGFIMQDDEFKTWKTFPDKLKPKPNQRLLLVKQSPFDLCFVPQRDAAPQLGIKVQCRFSSTDDRLAKFLAARNQPLFISELQALAEAQFEPNMLLPQMLEKEWEQVRAKFSNALQMSMGVMCEKIEQVVLADQPSLYERLTQAAGSDEPNEEPLPEAEQVAAIEPVQAESLPDIDRSLPHVEPVSPPVSPERRSYAWWQNLEKTDQALQQQLLHQLQQCIDHLNAYLPTLQAYDRHQREILQSLKQQLTLHYQNSQALPVLQPALAAFKRSRQEQERMLDAMHLSVQQGELLQAYLSDVCGFDQTVTNEQLHTLQKRQQAFAAALQQRRQY